MLVEFKVTNFRSFRDTQTLSMVASADQSLPENTIETTALGKQRLLKSAAIYGPNASGKSNLVAAFAFVRHFLTTSAQRRPGQNIRITPFLFDVEHTALPSEFEVTMIHEGVRYQYGLSVDKERIHKEWLIAYPKGTPQVWFERSSETGDKETSWYFGPRYRGERTRLTKLTRPDAPFLAIAATFNHVQLTPVYEWFSSPLTVLDTTQDKEWLEEIAIDVTHKYNSIRQRATQLLQYADLGIRGVSFVEHDGHDTTPTPDYPEGQQYELFDEGGVEPNRAFDILILHETQADDQASVSLPLDEESLGTRRFFGLLTPWILALELGDVLVIDELDASLHPTLVRTLIQMFHDPNINTKGAQLIFNTHDTTLLDSSLFRRDQFWFVEKDRAGASHLYSLLEYSPRKDEALERGYLQGRYGAIPNVGELLNADLLHAKG